MAILVEPGKTIGASLIWVNRGVLPYATAMRLQMRESSALARWQVGDWVTTPLVAPGERNTLVLEKEIPSNWDGRTVDVKVEDIFGSIHGLQDDYFIVLRNRFRWMGIADAFEWANTEHTWVYAQRTPQHRGAAQRVWMGFGIFPVSLIGEFASAPHDPNDIGSFGPDVWKGVWVDWAINGTWQSMPSPQQYREPFPTGYGEGAFAAFWVVQSESPVDRRSRGVAPVTYEFGDEANKWDLNLDRILVKGAAEVIDIPWGFF